MAKVSRKNLELAKKELKSYDDLCSEMEKKIKKEYQQAHKEVAKKAEDYFKRFEKKDVTWQKWVKDGTKTEQEYRAWRTSQMAMGQRWNDMRDVLATDLANTDKIASGIMNDYIPDAYALGHNWGTYEVESGTGINTSYTLYNHATVEELLKDDPNLLPKSKVKIPKDKIWNKRHLDSAITQGILQGESIPAIAKRLEAVTDMNHKAALRNARTMTGSAENAGHYASYKRAENMGIKLEKQWIATLDSRTRTSHRYLHGETQKMDDEFSNGLMYPKDPSGAPEEVYNCRCRLVSNVVGYSRDLPTYSEKMGGMSYEEWLEAKPVYQKITHGEEVAEAQKMRYINEYRRGAKNLKNKSSVVNGRDLSEEWHRRADRFDFEIEDVINAQGFDGKPRVVSAEEFDEAVKKSNFVAQRTYSAPDQETLDAYRDQLYNGKWYVDCSTGGAQHGQGMYCAGNYEGKLTEAIKQEMKDYQNQNLTYSGEKSVHTTETITLDKSAKIINQKDLVIEWAREYNPSVADWWAQVGGPDNIRDAAIDVVKNIRAQELVKEGLANNDFKAKRMLNDETKGLSYIEERNYWLQKAEKAGILTDNGSYAALKGYDAIRTNHGTSGADTIILNRTKVIFKGE